MKSYGQLCAIARALDVVGDRWALLVVRELLIREPLRFGELQRGLPGVATNLLSKRLRDLEANGVIVREVTPAVAGVPAYRLTERGRQLDGVLRELLKWGAPTVPEAPAEAIFQMHWLSQPARFLLQDHAPQEPPATIRFGTVEDGFDLDVAAGKTMVRPCRAERAVDTVVTGPGPALVALLQGSLGLATARARGVEVSGAVDPLQRVLPLRSR